MVVLFLPLSASLMIRVFFIFSIDIIGFLHAECGAVPGSPSEVGVADAKGKKFNGFYLWENQSNY